MAIMVGFSILMSCASTEVGITTKVQAKLAADDIVKASQIDVTTTNGVVTLTGNVDTEEQKDQALALARNTKGVVSVVDMISTRRASGGGDAPDANRTVGETFDDAGITMRVKGRLLDDPLVKGLQIDVDTRDGVVFLTGSVESDAQRDKAIDLARHTEQVQDVQANLTIQKR